MTEVIKLHYAGQILSKKNRHIVANIGGHRLIKPDKEAKANEDDMVMQFRAQLLMSRRRNQALLGKERRALEAKAKGETYDIKIRITEPNLIRRDLDNQASTIMDALTRSGAIADDCWQFVRRITIEAAGVNPEPYANIEIKINATK